MSFLLDTNVASEWVLPRPNHGGVAWLAEADEDRIFIGVVTLAELRYRIERMAAGQCRRHLDECVREELPLHFERWVPTIDAAISTSGTR